VCEEPTIGRERRPEISARGRSQRATYLPRLPNPRLRAPCQARHAGLQRGTVVHG
jgi:hypothetical protein